MWSQQIGSNSVILSWQYISEDCLEGNPELAWYNEVADECIHIISDNINLAYQLID